MPNPWQREKKIILVKMTELVTLESSDLHVVIAPQYGARLVNLIDKRSGREWLTQGPLSPNTGEDAVYSSAEAVAWDECFPTVSSCDARHTAWGRSMRDHGDLWGRPWSTDALTQERAEQHCDGREFSFARFLHVEGPMLKIGYRVTNRLDVPLPYLWALHALLAVDAGDRIELDAIASVRPTYLSTHTDAGAFDELPWAGPNAATQFPLTDVQPRTSGFAGKFLATGRGGARVGRAGSWLRFDWDERCPAVGLWLTYGGWPGPGGHQEIAIEPTSAAADDLNQAIAAGAPPLAPHETRRWEVVLTISA